MLQRIIVPIMFSILLFPGFALSQNEKSQPYEAADAYEIYSMLITEQA